MHVLGSQVSLVVLLFIVLFDFTAAFCATVSPVGRWSGSSRRGTSAHSLRLSGGAEVSMSGTPAGPLVSCEWLKENLGNVKVLDASWYLSSMERSPGIKFDGEHVL